MKKRPLTLVVLAVAVAGVAAYGMQQASASTSTQPVAPPSPSVTHGLAPDPGITHGLAPDPGITHGLAPDPSWASGGEPVPPSGDGPSVPSGSGTGATVDDPPVDVPTPVVPTPYVRGGGVLTGHLFGSGGVAPGVTVPWAGSVTVTGKGVHRVVRVGDNGSYSLSLPPGTYTVTGASPSHLGPATCPATHKAQVKAGRTVTVDVYCPIP